MNPSTGATRSQGQPGGFWQKYVAFLVDGFLIALGQFLILYITSAFDYMTMMILGYGTYLAYFTGFIASSLQSTPGGLLVGLKVQNIDGDNISVGKSFIRALASLLSAAVLCLGYLCNGPDGTRQSSVKIVHEGGLSWPRSREFRQKQK
ncbi:MAG: RDD family protein [Oligoflexales bacterium]|nr:RDD family protein [Oligoflexales bacterium]